VKDNEKNASKKASGQGTSSEEEGEENKHVKEIGGGASTEKGGKKRKKPAPALERRIQPRRGAVVEGSVLQETREEDDSFRIRVCRQVSNTAPTAPLRSCQLLLEGFNGSLVGRGGHCN
jgi:hypothetical protein